MEELSRRLRVAGRVKFLGVSGKVGELLRRADLFVFPSLSEGFGIAVVEAMASGVPVLATDLVSLREIMGEGGGVLVPPASPGAIADSAVRILGNRESAGNMGREGRRIACERFSAKRFVSDLEELYLSILFQKGFGTEREVA